MKTMAKIKASRHQFIQLRVADWEKGYIQYKAESANMTLSEFVRRAAMYKEVNVLNGTDEEVLRELRYQGNNLNQLTVMARQGRIQLVNFEPFVEVYEKVWQALNSSASRVV